MSQPVERVFGAMRRPMMWRLARNFRVGSLHSDLVIS